MNSMRFAALLVALLLFGIADPHAGNAGDPPPIPEQNPVMDSEVANERARAIRAQRHSSQRPGWYVWGSDRDWRYRERAKHQREREKRWRKQINQAEKRERKARKRAKHGKKKRSRYGDRGHERDYDRDHDPEPDRNGHGSHSDHEPRYRIVFDSQRGVRIVIEHPGLYFEAGHYYRFHDGGWQVGGNGETDWTVTVKAHVPLGIRVAHEAWYYGGSDAAGSGVHR